MHINVFQILKLLLNTCCYFISISQIHNSNDKDMINIIFAMDESMLPLAMVSVGSIIRYSTNPSRLYFHFVLINMKWDSKLIHEIEKSICKKCKLVAKHWDPMPEIIKSMHIRNKQRQDLASPENYARFYISSLFPSINRFIYLDNDILAVQSIDSLWNIDLGNKMIGMVHDCGSWFNDHVIKNNNYNLTHPIVKNILFNHNSITNNLCHPNAGIMLVNQKIFNVTNQLKRIEELILLNQKEFIYKLGSQPLVTLISWNNYFPLDDKWNVRTQPKTNSDDVYAAVIIHFNGKGRKSFMYRYIVNKFLNQKDTYINKKDHMNIILTSNNTNTFDIKQFHNNSNYSNYLYGNINQSRKLKFIIMTQAEEVWISTANNIFQKCTILIKQYLCNLTKIYYQQYEILSDNIVSAVVTKVHNNKPYKDKLQLNHTITTYNSALMNNKIHNNIILNSKHSDYRMKTLLKSSIHSQQYLKTLHQ